MEKYKMNKKSGPLDKVLGIIAIIIALVLLYVEYSIVMAIKSIGLAIATFLGIDGAASLGVVLLCCVPAVGLIIMVGIITCLLFWTGYKLFSVGW